MALASLPQWLEFVLNKKYPKWREVERNKDGTARYMPAGVRVLEKSLLREYATDEVVACFPDDLDKFIGSQDSRRGRFHAQPTWRHVCCRRLHFDFGSSKEPLNSIYSRAMFDKINPVRTARIFRWLLVGQVVGRSSQTNKLRGTGR